jgi:GntR family transcriptional regulator, transcriptional repressor for pyruvate dehydrogenase complex
LARTLNRVLKLPNALPLSLKEHIIILDAIERHDAEGARKAMHAHLDAVLVRYAKALEAGDGPKAEQNGTVRITRKRTRSAS